MFFILYIIFYLVEGGMDSKSGRFGCFTRMTLYKIFEILLSTLILSYYFNERSGTTKDDSAIVNVFLGIMIIAFVLVLAAEFIVAFIAIFFSDANKV